MRKSLITYSLVSVITALAVVSCTDESETYSDNENGIFRLSSGQEAFTRAAETTFEPGTTYQLYAIEGTDFGTNYLKNPAASGAVIGTEQENKTIGDIKANKFNGKTLNFYGVTNSTITSVTIVENSSSAVPTSHIEYSGNAPLTDIMWAKKENQTYKNSGTIEMPFKHTLSKLNLYVMKNAEETEAVTLTGISLTDYPSGSLDIGTGRYVTGDNDQRNHSVNILNSASQTVTTSATRVTNADVEVAPMVFPTRKSAQGDIANHALRIKVEVTVGNAAIKQETKITTVLAEEPQAPEAPFNFKSNHEYDVVITVTRNSLVVTVVPRLYDWIPDEEIKVDSDVNGSMTVGGITWMDRNLGASSGNPLAGDQAWEDSRGYFYQFGRNIPYYIKTKFEDKNGIIYAPSNGNWYLEESCPYPYIPGHMIDEPSTQPSKNTAQYPKEPSKEYNFIYGKKYWDNKLSDASRSNWENTDNHPCPKGWRIPTRDEFQLIIPKTAKAGDIPFNLDHGKNSTDNDGKTYIETEEDDPESKSNSIYVGVKKGTWDATNVGITNSIYALKRQGDNDAYYLRWHIERSGIYEIPNNNNTDEKGDPYRNVLVISRYPATSKSTLNMDNVEKVAKWDKPVEQIKLPISGYVKSNPPELPAPEKPLSAALIYSGSEAVYWTNTINNDNSYTVRMKFAGDSDNSQIYIYDSEIRNNGCLIRCVRDTKAN